MSNPPTNYIRIAQTDADGTPILNEGEWGVEHDGVFYVLGDGVELQA